jgi:hypothetical protein
LRRTVDAVLAFLARSSGLVAMYAFS